MSVLLANSALLLSWGPKTVMVHIHRPCATLQNSRVVSDHSHGGEQEPRQSRRRRAISWHGLWDIWCLVQAQGGGDQGGEVGNPGRQPTKRLLANGIKEYQNISKNFKNCQAWQTHSAGSPRTCGAALCFRSLSWRPGHRPFLSEDAQNLQRQRGCGRAMARTGTSGLRF